MENKILVLDIETTGFSHKNDCILELGIVSLDLDTGEIVELFNKTFHEPHMKRGHLKSWIFENSDMNPEVIRVSEDLSYYSLELQAIFDMYLGKVVAFNRPFDINFLKARGFDLGEDCLDPMRESTDYFKLPNKNGWKGYKWPKVQEAYDLLFPEIKGTYIEQHRGLDDAKHEAELIHELIKRGVYKLR